MIPAALLLTVFFLYSLVSRRLEKTILTAPIFFTTVGMLMLPALPSMLKVGITAPVFLRLAEVGLVLLLFTDASRTDAAVLRRIGNLPARLLSVGMLLTIVAGAIAAKLFFPSLSIWEAGILGAILAPTDAGLGQIIVNSPRVPAPVRQALNVEAGLNDGLSVPFMLFFITLAAAKSEGGAASLMQYIVEQLGFGVVIGAAIGLVGGGLLGVARRRQWVAESFLQIGVVVLPLLCLVLSEMAGASMFIASFVAGFTVQVGFKDAAKHSVEFAEDWGQLLNLTVFLLFGILVARDWPQFGAPFWLYAVTSLTLVRMLPVWIALIGTRLSPASVLFMGWFGPRGLASIVLGLVYLEQELDLPGESTLRLAVMVTVLLSIFAHGISAIPGIGWYTRALASLDGSAPERQDITQKAVAT